MNERLLKRISRPILEISEPFQDFPPPETFTASQEFGFTIKQKSEQGTLDYHYSGALVSDVISLDNFEGKSQRYDVQIQ